MQENVGINSFVLLSNKRLGRNPERVFDKNHQQPNTNGCHEKRFVSDSWRFLLSNDQLGLNESFKYNK